MLQSKLCSWLQVQSAFQFSFNQRCDTQQTLFLHLQCLDEIITKIYKNAKVLLSVVKVSVSSIHV